ncbi:dodecin family protein [Clostridium sp. Cult3]|jgi:flavin-binding protein dodecin|uniref:dodecin family protein n=1 Tax=Clostridium sp. Cult3 TaxID=2079004 RepID=UPI00169CD017|nr:dodecin family protein [Clostridium sp. Cult3]MCF6460894.1 dodecin domain-containing protein [Clostridium sp. Cult3]NLV76153.1 dodecin domain-containing protein [Tissierellia bacterium]
MAVVKVIELLSESANGWEAAAQEAVSEASKTIENIQSVYVSNMQAIVEKGKIINYRLNVKISFIVK